jgi:alpha-tubulin suppressor-like RCC1 family protein
LRARGFVHRLHHRQAGGGFHNLALKGDGTVVAWGAGTNNSGLSYKLERHDAIHRSRRRRLQPALLSAGDAVKEVDPEKRS